jgi:hypothetical protein
MNSFLVDTGNDVDFEFQQRVWRPAVCTVRKAATKNRATRAEAFAC